MSHLITKLFIGALLGTLVACEAQNKGGLLEPVGDTPLPTSMSDALKLELQGRPALYTKTYRKTFNKLATDGVVTSETLQFTANKMAAAIRGKVAAELLGADINGDGQVSVGEALSLSQAQNYDWNKKTTTYIPLGDADLNDDGIITISEILLFARNSPQISQQINRSKELAINSFDENKDGIVNKDELENGLAKLVGKDVSAKLPTAPNYNANRPLSYTQTQNNPPKECTPVAPAKQDEVVFVSGYEGSGLSSVALTGKDRESEVARLVIEQGDKPLYIVASSFTPVVWSLEGDVNRVSKFITQPNQHPKGPGVGVIGLPKDKIEFIGRGCLNSFWDSSGVKAIQAKALWGKIVTKTPDSVHGAYTIVSMNLPSGRNGDKRAITRQQRERRAAQGETFGLYRYTVEGLITIDPKKVTAPSPVETYDVMPQQAGLVQLVKSGHMTPLGRGAFKIVKPIPRFPAGLNGGHSVTFVLGTGVPLPSGSSGHSKVISEETGECLSSRRCT